MAKKVVLAGACRTAIGTMGGALSTTPAPVLGSIVIKEALNRAGVPADQVDHVYMGCVIQAGLGQNVARQASLKAGLPIETPAVTVNVVCGSGLNCVNMAAQMIQAGDFRKGVTVEIDGQVWSVVDFQHVKPGKGAAFVRTRLKNVMTGAVLERTFSPTDKYPTAHIETKEMQYLYNDGDLYYFMDTETYEQLPLNHEQVEDAINYIIENDTVTVRFFKGNPFSVQPANFVTLTVTECEPGVRGDTATGANKPATVETGLKIVVPLFVNEGDKVRIDTRTGEYMERV